MKKLSIILLLTISFVLFGGTVQAKEEKGKSEPNKLEELQQEIKNLEESLNPNLPQENEIAIREKLIGRYRDLISLKTQWRDYLAAAPIPLRNQQLIDEAATEIKTNEGKQQEHKKKLMALWAGPVQANGNGIGSFSSPPTGKDKTSLSGFVFNDNCERLQNVLIQIEIEKGGQRRSCNTDPNGQLSFPNLQPGVYKLIAELDGFNKEERKLTFVPGETDPLTILLKPKKDTEGPYFRGGVGIQQLGSSSKSSEQKLFADLFFSSGLGKTLAPSLRIWGQVQTASAIPSDKAKGIREVANTLNQSVFDISAEKAVKSIEFMVGAQYKLLGESLLNMRPSLVAGFGAITPPNPEQEVTTAKVYELSDDARSRFGIPKCTPGDSTCIDKAYISFIPRDRNRFFRQYYAGLRMEAIPNSPEQKRAIFDVMIGQNEAVTGGRLRGPVLRLDGFYPLPTGVDSIASFIYLFGTAHLRFARNQDRDPLILNRSDASISSSDPKLVIQAVPVDDRDSYRIGVGIDLIGLIKKAMTNSSKSATNATNQ
jgi:hypothetical protein